MKSWKHASLGMSLLAAMLLAGGGCDFGDPVDHASGGGTSIDGLTGNLVVTGGSPAAGAMVRVFPVGGPLSKLAKSAHVSALDSVQADPAGRFQFKNLPDGTYNLSASLHLADNTVLALYLPGIVVAGKTYLGVDTLQLTGSIVLQVRGAGNTAIAGALCSIAGGAWQTSSDSTGVCTLTEVPPGTFQATITHPSYLTGLSADVTVTGGMSMSGGVVILVATASPLPVAPLLVYPSFAISAALSQPVMQWRSVENAASYHLQLTTDSTFVNLVVNDSGLADTTRSVGPLTGTWHYWRVRAKNGTGAGPWSAHWRFMGASTAGLPPAPTPTYPLSGAADVPATPTFTWNPVSGATGYHLEVVGSNFISIPLVNDSTLTGTSRAAGPLEYLVTYGWRVKARNAAGWGPWSATNTIFRDEMPEPALAAPQLTSPATGITVSVGFSLTWSAVTGATSYRVQVSTSPTFSTFSLNDTNATTSRSTALLNFSTTYYWRVHARNAAGTSDWSEVRSFTTAHFIDVVLLPAPILSAPTDSAMFIETMPTLTWSASNGAMTYQVQLSTSAAFSSMIVNDSNLTATSRTVGPLVLGTKYFWRVRGMSPSAIGDWSAVRSFTTAAPTSGSGTWTTQTSGTTANLNAVTWTGTQYVAVGDGGTIRTSPDGINWTARASGTTQDLYAVAWTGSLLVAGGDEVGGLGTVVFRTSPDGANWTPRVSGGPSIPGQVRSIQWTGGQLLAGGTSGGFWSSTDGITWVGGEFILGATWMSGGIVGNTKVMVSGPSITTGTGEVAVSTVGSQEWASYATGTKSFGTGLETGEGYGGLSSVVSTGSLFVGVVGIAATISSLNIPPISVTNFGTIMTSTNGMTWTTRVTESGMSHVIWTGTQLAAMAANGATMTSADGVTWTPGLPSSTATSLKAFVRGNAWVAVGANGSIVIAP